MNAAIFLFAVLVLVTILIIVCMFIAANAEDGATHGCFIFILFVVGIILTVQITRRLDIYDKQMGTSITDVKSDAKEALPEAAPAK